jgi:hypothetical protein
MIIGTPSTRMLYYCEVNCNVHIEDIVRVQRKSASSAFYEFASSRFSHLQRMASKRAATAAFGTMDE